MFFILFVFCIMYYVPHVCINSLSAVEKSWRMDLAVTLTLAGTLPMKEWGSHCEFGGQRMRERSLQAEEPESAGMRHV